ncbi:hypothetical protein O181_116991, partial [Austropuccinia psidii MF-1]|nr:hypothetical protein [Austropuccinia psidii MF-1]
TDIVLLINSDIIISFIVTSYNSSHKSKRKNISPEERQKWRIPEIPPVPKDLNHFQHETIVIYHSQYKNWFMATKQQEWELLPSLWIGTMNSYLQVKKLVGPEKTEELLNGWKPMSCKGQVQQIKLAQGKENSTVEAPQASTSAKTAQENPKEQPEGQEKGKGKGKAQVEQALTEKLQASQEREESHGQFVQYGKNSYGIQKQGRGKIETIFSKEVDLVKLVNQIETCNNEIIAKFKTFEYIQQKLGNEILQLKELQKTISGLENVNKDNILPLAQMF